MYDVIIPDDVAALIGPAHIDRIRSNPLDYRCVGCHRPGRLGDGTLVALRVEVATTDRQTIVKFMHPDCGDVGVFHLAGRTATLREQDVVAVAGAIGRMLGGPVPFLIVEHMMSTFLHNGPAGESIDLMATTLCGAGMEPIADLAFPPPPAPGWRVTMPHRGVGGSIVGPDHLTLMAPLSELVWPTGWAELVTDHYDGRCAVYVTAGVGLRALTADPARHLFAAAIDAVCKAGQVVGTVAEVRFEASR